MGRLTPTRRFLAALLGATLVLTGCTVPTDDNAAVIADSELPESLQRVTTTTTTTAPPGEIRDVTYYLLLVPDDQTQRKVFGVNQPIPDTDILDPLIRPMFAPDFAAGAAEEELVNQVTQFEFITVRRDGTPIATVELTADEENPPSDEVITDMAAQLVWTLTQFEFVDAVQVVINGELQALPTDEGRTDEPVTTQDYRSYDPDFTPEPVTTTTTVVPPTTVAPSTSVIQAPTTTSTTVP